MNAEKKEGWFKITLNRDGVLDEANVYVPSKEQELADEQVETQELDPPCLQMGGRF